jgi:hypothetical protein
MPKACNRDLKAANPNPKIIQQIAQYHLDILLYIYNNMFAFIDYMYFREREACTIGSQFYVLSAG